MKKTISIIIFIIFAFGVGYYFYDTYYKAPVANNGQQPGGVLAGTTWQMVSYHGQPAIEVPQNRLFVEFTDTEVKGRICNIYNGKYINNGMMFVAKDVISTKMACMDSAGAIENVFFSGLSNGFQYKVEGSSLSLIDSTTGARFEFVSAPKNN